MNFAFVRILLLVLLPNLLAAQETSKGDDIGTLPLLNGPIEDGIRRSHLFPGRGGPGFLIRSPSTLLPPDIERGKTFATLGPMVESIWNSDHSYSPNEGALWAGRGINAIATVGFRLRAAAVDVVIAPQLTYAQNLDYQTIESRDTARSVWASPWHVGVQSVDLPQRFGDAPLLQLHPGQSTAALRMGLFRTGITTENEWWGPGTRNALVLSSNAEGFPRAFVDTPGTIGTPIGAFKGRWIVGSLSKSLYYDHDPERGRRSLSGVVLTYSPTVEPNLTVGLGRTVYAAAEDATDIARHATDAFVRWKSQIVPPDSTIADSVALAGLRASLPPGRDYEQLTSIFARWIFPAEHLEVYAEWARTQLPVSVRDLLVQPEHGQGYTLGLQWIRPSRRDRQVRVQAEATYLEESASFNNRPTPSFYVSWMVPQGYTHRGRTLGAAIGPGGSSQWLAADLLSRRWDVGVQVGRIRWNNDVYYRGVDRAEVTHDVSLLVGARGGFRAEALRGWGEVLFARRLNYLFQNPALDPWGTNAVDRSNLTLRFGLSPR